MHAVILMNYVLVQIFSVVSLRFSIYKNILCKNNDLAFFQVQMPYMSFHAWLLSLGLPELYWVIVVKVSLSSSRSLKVSTFPHLVYVSYRCILNKLSFVEVHFFLYLICTYIIQYFYWEGVLNFLQWLCSIFEMTICFFSFILLTWCSMFID